MWEQVVIESKANQKRGPVISIKFFFFPYWSQFVFQMRPIALMTLTMAEGKWKRKKNQR